MMMKGLVPWWTAADKIVGRDERGAQVAEGGVIWGVD